MIFLDNSYLLNTTAVAVWKKQGRRVYIYKLNNPNQPSYWSQKHVLEFKNQ